MIVGVVLAAGLGRRFGGEKLLRPLGGRPLIRFAVDSALASRLDRIVVVSSASDQEIRRALRGAERLEFLENPDPSRGHMSSLKLALSHLEAEAAVVLLGDMPLVPSSLIDRLVEAYRTDGRSVVPRCDERWQHPRLLAASLFPQFLQLADDERGSQLLLAAGKLVQELEIGAPEHYLDVDHPDDLARIEAVLASRSPEKLD